MAGDWEVATKDAPPSQLRKTIKRNVGGSTSTQDAPPLQERKTKKAAGSGEAQGAGNARRIVQQV